MTPSQVAPRAEPPVLPAPDVDYELSAAEHEALRELSLCGVLGTQEPMEVR
jgi:hypothetical protein